MSINTNQPPLHLKVQYKDDQHYTPLQSSFVKFCMVSKIHNAVAERCGVSVISLEPNEALSSP